MDSQIGTSFTQWISLSLLKDVKFEAKQNKINKKGLIGFNFHLKWDTKWISYSHEGSFSIEMISSGNIIT